MEVRMKLKRRIAKACWKSLRAKKELVIWCFLGEKA
jgi:hypothetical protein